MNRMNLYLPEHLVIFRVDVSGEYERRLDLLYHLQDQKHGNLITKEVTEDLNVIEEVLTAAKTKNLIVTICIDEDQEDIMKLNCDTTDEKTLKLLYENRKHN